jgi:hypothetical protein
VRRFAVTASGIWRAMICLGSAILPRAPSSNRYAEHGSAGHTFLLDCNRLGREQALAKVQEKYRTAFALIDIDRLPIDPAAYAAEVAVAVDVVTGAGRELHRKGDRDYSMCAATEIPGTADVVALIDGDAAYVGDYKFGHKALPSPRLNWQFRALALMVARAFGRSRVVVEMIRVGEDGSRRDRRLRSCGDRRGTTGSACQRHAGRGNRWSRTHGDRRALRGVRRNRRVHEWDGHGARVRRR